MSGLALNAKIRFFRYPPVRRIEYPRSQTKGALILNRQEKQKTVEEQHQAFQDSQAVVVFHYRGTTVAQMTEMRQKGYEDDVTVKVTKNTLTKRALKDTKFEALEDLFSGPTAIAYSQSPVMAAKLVANQAKENDNLKIIGGAMGDKSLNESQIKELASLPSLDELRSKLVGLISAPAQRIATVTQAPATQLARVLKAYSEKG